MIFINGEEIKSGNVYIINNLLFSCIKVTNKELTNIPKRVSENAKLRFKLLKNYFMYITVIKTPGYSYDKYILCVRQIKPQTYLISPKTMFNILTGLNYIYDKLEELSKIRPKNRIENIDKMLEELQTIKDQTIIKDILE